MFSTTDGFQVVHAIYAVEHFLHGLLQRKCNFHIVFFDTHENLCIPPGTESSNRFKYLLARAVVLRHLRINLGGPQPAIAIEEFKSTSDIAFQDYLRATGIYFIMCHDGASPGSPASGNDIALPTPSHQAEVESLEKSRKILFRAMICDLINKGYNIALINGLEWRDTKVSTKTWLARNKLMMGYR